MANEKKNNVSSQKVLETNIEAYQNFQDKPDSISFDDDDLNEHLVPCVDELSEVKDKEKYLEDVKLKCKFKQEYVDQNIILSVNHLKQYFFFGSGANRYKLKAVHDVSFQVKEGECFGIVGESGCGKTTTGRSIIRLYNITSGSIYYKGHRIGAGSRWNEKEIKYTKIRLKNKLKSLKKDLKENKISKETYEKEIKEAKEHAFNIIKVQKAKIAQIKRDDKVASTYKVNDSDIKIAKAQLHDVNELIKKVEAGVNNDKLDLNKLISYKDELNKKIENLKASNHRIMSEIQMIFQDPIDSLDPRMTVETIISEGLKIQGFKNPEENHKKVVAALEKVGLIEDYASRYPHEFSGGQRQRIGIARALVMNPKLLICDEPISALDVSIRAQIINLLNELKEEMNLSLIFIAHDLSVVKYFCDRIAVMYFGEIVELASSDELFKHPLHPYTKSLLSAIPKPNPITEKKRKRILYNPSECHDYSVDKPKFVEIEPGHFILANESEIVKYKEEIAMLDKKLKEEKATESDLDEKLNNEENLNETSKNLAKPSLNDENSDLSSEENLKKDEETTDLKMNETELKELEEFEKESLKESKKKYKKVYHLKKVDGKWQIILREGKKVIKTFKTKAEGLDYGKALAKSQNGTLLVHASKGKNKGKFQ